MSEIDVFETPAILHARTSDGAVQLLPIDQVHESPWNPRQIYAEGPLAELAESMRATGFRTWRPIIARPFASGGVEVGAGHRRLRAAHMAGLAHVPVIVTEMTDDSFRDVLNFDNDGAEPVHPLHAAAGWRAHMEHTGVGVIDIAARIGKSKEYVYQLLQLFNLTEPAQRAFLEGAFTKQHAVVLARHGADAQTAALKWLAGQPHLPGHRDLDAWFRGRLYMDLNVAPFALDDSMLLAGAGTCIACPKRAANVPGYEAPENDATDACMDGACYGQKIDNHLLQLEREASGRGERVVKLSDLSTPKKRGAYSHLEWHDAAPNDPLVCTGVVVESALPGRVGAVIPVVLVSEVRFAASVAKQNAAPPAAPPPNADERAMRDRYAESEAKRQADDDPAAEEREARYKREDAEAEAEAQADKAKRSTEGRVRQAILDAVIAKVGGLTRADLEDIAAMLVPSCGEIETLARLQGIAICESDEAETERSVLNAIPKMREPEFFGLLIRLMVIDDLGDWRMSSEPAALLALAKRYKVDASKIRSGIENPVPAPKDSRKASIAKLGTLAEKSKPAPKGWIRSAFASAWDDPPKKAARKNATPAPVKKTATPAKKAPAKKAAKKSAKKGGKK